MKGKMMNHKKLNNRGVAMISIMIAVAFITVIASALLYITYTNFSMKTMNLRSKENFYELDGMVNRVSAETRNLLNETTTDDPSSNITKLTVNGDMPTETTAVQYDVRNFYYMGHPVICHIAAIRGRIGNPGVAADATEYASYREGVNITASWSGGGNDVIRTSTEGTDDDRFGFYTEYGTGDNGKVTMKVDSSTGATTYTFHNLCIEERAAGGYVNRIKTDIEITTVKKTGTGDEGGIGDFSMLSDSSLKVDGGGFTVMDIYGNSYFSSTDGTGTYEKSDGTTATFTKPGTNAVVLNDESKINVIGQYLVVYGDIVLNDNSCLYIGSGNLTVYGDIILNGHSTLICNGKIYMVEGKLPGRTEESKIKIATGTTKEQHIYPSSTTVTKLTKAQFEEFCHTLLFDDANTANDGITKQILKSVTLSGGTFDPANFSGNINGNPKGELTSFFGQDIAVGFNTQDTINNDMKNRVCFNLKEAKIRESNPCTTIISCKPVTVDQKHSVSVTKIGDDVFEWLIGCQKTDTSNPLFDAKVHNFKLETSTAGSGYISTADLFQPDCNPKVKKMLRQATGGGSGSDSYYSSIRLVNYVKDYE